MAASEDGQKILQKHYLGFVVVRPIPFTFVGRTCLKIYDPVDPKTSSKRHYPTTRPSVVHLCGVELQVDTLAFQEQDSVAAACASSALWSALQSTAMLFQHSIPSPVEITRLATRHLPLETRVFPNKGLNAIQMADAVRAVGLEPLSLPVISSKMLVRITYAYLRGKIPIIFILKSSMPGRRVSWHAIAITGFNYPDGAKITGCWDEALMSPDVIEKLYAHDDQIGPFARCLVKSDNIVELPVEGLSVSYRVENVLIPLHRQIRIHFDDINLGLVQPLHYLFAEISEIARISPVSWEIYLDTSSNIKKDLLKTYGTANDEIWRFLSLNLPRFIWRVGVRTGNSKCFEVLIDATDVPAGNSVQSLILYQQHWIPILKGLSDHSSVRDFLIRKEGKMAVRFFAFIKEPIQDRVFFF